MTADTAKDMKDKKDNKALQVQTLTVKVLEKIDSLGLQSTPEIYELWYRYFEGHPDIVRAIDAQPGAVDEKLCVELHTKFFTMQAQEGSIRRVNNEVQNSINTLVSRLKSATAATTEYGDTLDGVAERLDGATTIDQLADVVANMLTDTKRMVSKNRELEGELVKSTHEVEELKQYLDTVKKEATTDGLTDIANRKSFDSTLREAVEISAKEEQPLTLLLLDIDHFKNFNDTFGHPMGDQVLRLVARVLVGNIKGQDTAARYGGEEFAVILPDTPLVSGAKVAETLRRAIETRELVNKSDNKKLGSITISIGVAELRPGEQPSTLIERADEALYKAKNAGRNRVSTAD